MIVKVKFIHDDKYGLWKAGEEAEDLGLEAFGLPLRLLRLESGEVISLSDPYGRGLVEKVEAI